MRNQHLAETALRPWTPVFTHGDLHTVTLGHEEHLDDVIAGYGADVDRDLIHTWRAWRYLIAIRWLSENGYGPPERYPEVAVLRSLS